MLVSVTLKRPRLCKLVATMWSVLEQNVSEAVVAEFKREFHQLSLRWTGVLVRALPGLSEDQAKQFARFFLLFTAGAWPASKPSPALERVLAREEFGEMKMNLDSTLSSCASTLLRGMLGVAKKTRGPRT